MCRKRKDITLQRFLNFRRQSMNGTGLPIDFGRGVARAVYLLVSQSYIYRPHVPSAPVHQDPLENC